MASFQDIENVRNILKSASTKNIVALHKFIFEEEGHRNNRKRLREFEGFEYNENDANYRLKTQYVQQNLTAADLVSICVMLGLNYDGDNLCAHICNHLRKGSLLQVQKNQLDEEDDEELEENDDGAGIETVRSSNDVGENQDNASNYDDAKSHQSHAGYVNKMKTKNNNNYKMPSFSLSFRDIEESVRTFDGTNSISIELWIDEFEETASIMHMNDFEKFVFAKKLLKGIAALFIKSERGVTSWAKLKEVLIEEFQQQVNSAQIHKQLSETKAKRDEPLKEYFLKMKEIATRGSVEDQALIQYVIDGINDLSTNKSVLYGAKNIREFKDKLTCYETIREKQQRSHEPKTYLKEKSMPRTPKPKQELSCYSCGSKGHIATSCPNKEKGSKCFRCNQFGHKSTNCPKKQTEQTTSNVRSIAKRKNEIMKEVKIGTNKYTALFDTGSKLNLMTNDIYKSLRKPALRSSHIQLKGFGEEGGRSCVKPLGFLFINIEIDGKVYNEKFLVVSEKCLDVQMVLGAEFCDSKEVKIDSNGIHFEEIISNNTVKADILEEGEIEQFDILKIDYETTPEINKYQTASVAAKEKVFNLVKNYEPVPTKSTNVEMKIVLNDETPIFSRPHRLPLTERRIVDEQVEKWLKDKIIEPSNSEYTSPVVLAKKRDGKFRLCVDYRKINKVIVKDRYPLPLIEDQLDNLKGAVVFSTIDLENGFFHEPVAQESRKYTSFVTHNGQFQFKRVPFGLCNSPSVFQRHINMVFRELTKDGIAFPYIDDVVVTANNEEEAVRNLEKVITTAKDYGLKLNLKKCHFLQREVEFLGHMIKNISVTKKS